MQPFELTRGIRSRRAFSYLLNLVFYLTTEMESLCQGWDKNSIGVVYLAHPSELL